MSKANPKHSWVCNPGNRFLRSCYLHLAVESRVNPCSSRVSIADCRDSPVVVSKPMPPNVNVVSLSVEKKIDVF